MWTFCRSWTILPQPFLAVHEYAFARSLFLELATSRAVNQKDEVVATAEAIAPAARAEARMRAIAEAIALVRRGVSIGACENPVSFRGDVMSREAHDRRKRWRSR